ncbi:hypothetical protein [Halosegnis longus]|uniref:hypothetical protein n=1 Tax=Halosegnis longus TaxID=2216012 RepID=UPI00129DFC39|nr:hypothetical protein [Halosegnis longus]
MTVSYVREPDGPLFRAHGLMVRVDRAESFGLQRGETERGTFVLTCRDPQSTPVAALRFNGRQIGVIKSVEPDPIGHARPHTNSRPDINYGV